MKSFFIWTFLVALALSPVLAEAQPQTKEQPQPAKAAEAPSALQPAAERAMAQHLQDISVTIVSMNRQGGGEGSGFIKTRKMPNGETVNFVWTAAHVVDNLRKTRQVIDSKSGTQRTIVEFDDAMVVKALNEEGRMVGKIEFYAEVIRYSAEQDLALLRLRKKNFVQSSVVFDLNDKIPDIGTELFHVGSLLGQLGSNSMTRGIMSQHGRLINKIVFDQTTVAAFPGSSGGGVYLRDGKCVGMVVRGAGETFNLIVPVRRIRDWAKSANIEWAIDDSVKMISEDELRKLPIEDNGVEFSHARKTDDPKGGDKSRLIITGNGKPYLGTEEQEFRFPTYHYYRLAPKADPSDRMDPAK